MSNSLDAVLAQYEKNKQSGGSSKPQMTSEERMKQYLSIMLPKGTKSGEKRIRIVPTTDGSSPFKEVFFHNVQVQGRWQKFMTQEKMKGKPSGERSPLNEVEEALRLAGDAQSKELARSISFTKILHCKSCDRDNEEDGVKFWRFKHNWKGDGPIDKIIPIWRNKGDVTDINEGRDLILIYKQYHYQVVEGEYTTVSSVMYEDPGKLSEDDSK
jgi:hypothetical protein